MSEHNLSRRLLLYAQLFFGMAFFGTGTPSARVAGDAFPLFLGPLLRLLVAGIVLLPLIFLNRSHVKGMSRRDILDIVVIGGIGIVGFTLFLMTGMRRVSGVIGAVVMSLSPAVMALAAVLFRGERLGWRKGLAVASAVAGVLVINVYGKTISADGWVLLLGSLLVFAAVCSQTAYSLIGKRVMSDLSPVVVLPLAVWVAILLFAVPGIVQGFSFDFSAPTFNEWFGLVLWGLGPLAIGTSIWFSGLQKVQASTASGFMGAMPATGLLLSYFWLGETFYPVHIVGFVLVLAGIYLITRAHRLEEAGE